MPFRHEAGLADLGFTPNMTCIETSKSFMVRFFSSLIQLFQSPVAGLGLPSRSVAGRLLDRANAGRGVSQYQAQELRLAAAQWLSVVR